jgi:hypothetical protein
VVSTHNGGSDLSMEEYTIAALESQFAVFLQANPYSSIGTHLLAHGEGDAQDRFVVECPWGDQTLAIVIPDGTDDRKRLAETLNSIKLPKRYSAIYHTDRKVLEVIWTAYKRSHIAKDVEAREFDFHFLGRVHHCEFSQSSDRLLDVAKYAMPISSPGPSEHRNLMSYIFYVNNRDEPDFGPPVSFHISVDDLDDAVVFDLVQHLNAYMTFYDSKSPRILVHESNEVIQNTQRPRYMQGKFPKKIMARNIDSNVLSFWAEMISSGNPVMRFLLGHRIMEYCAFNYVEIEAKTKIKRILSAPDVHDRLDQISSDVAEIIGIFKETHESSRLNQLVSATLDKRRLWGYVEGQREFFQQDSNFEGGFCVKAALSKADTFETWSTKCVQNTLKSVKEIRNALAHGQDGPTRGTIRPTRGNQTLLRPWLNVVEIIACDAILYRDIG